MTNHAILGLTPSQRRELFEAAERVITLRAAMIEKDFWVYWTLGQLFSLPDAREHFIFKGGTSLSKVWGAIHRFSEDIDISLSREWLGFSGERDPEGAASGNKRRQLLDDLSKACAVRLRDDVLPALRAVMMESLGASDWSLEVDMADPQTLLFAYPTALTDAPSYIRPVVKIECGARSDRWPVQMGRLTPYVADAFPEALKGEPLEVSVLGIERTFWEKATILHAEAHRRAEQPTPERYSRHYADLAALANHDGGKLALCRDDLRERVVAHKKIFFAATWAAYDTAVPGSFRLVPPEARREELARDYAAMRDMFFHEPPLWEEVIKTLEELETRINNPVASLPSSI